MENIEIVDKSQKKIVNSFCEFLGMVHDSSTAQAFPSEWNACNRCQPPTTPNIEHQRNFCLTGSYQLCPVFSNEKIISLPKKLSYPIRNTNIQKKKLFFRGFVLTILIFVIAGGLLFAWLNSSGNLPDFPYLTNLPQIETSKVISTSATLKPIVSLTPIQNTEVNSTQVKTIIPSPSPSTPSPTPLYTITSTQKVSTDMHRLDEPFGKVYRLVIHRIQEGDNLYKLVEQYNTDLQSIFQINLYLPAPIRSDLLVIIPVDRIDIRGIPRLQAYMVMTDGLTIEDFAQILYLSSYELKLFNGLEDGYLLSKGEWIVIPYH
ncbi:MAG: hypothetical protein ABIJ65_15630 [Chloroflexota bacterium]